MRVSEFGSNRDTMVVSPGKQSRAKASILNTQAARRTQWKTPAKQAATESLTDIITGQDHRSENENFNDVEEV